MRPNPNRLPKQRRVVRRVPDVPEMLSRQPTPSAEAPPQPQSSTALTEQELQEIINGAYN